MSIEQLTARVRQSFNGCPQCSKRGYVPDCIFCGGVSVDLTNEQNEMMTESEITMTAIKKKTDSLKKTKSPTLDVDTKVKNEFTDISMHFTGIHGGVLVAIPTERDSRVKNKQAVVVRIDCQDTCWSFYNCRTVFTLFSQDEKTCRFQCAGRYVIFACRIIRDADDLPEAIAQAAADLWKAE